MKNPYETEAPPAYFTDLIQDALHLWREHSASMGYPPDLLNELENKADILELMLDPINDKTGGNRARP